MNYSKDMRYTFVLPNPIKCFSHVSFQSTITIFEYICNNIFDTEAYSSSEVYIYLLLNYNTKMPETSYLFHICKLFLVKVISNSGLK